MPTFSSGCDFMLELGKPQPHAKLEVTIFSRFCDVSWKNSRCLPILKSLASADAEISRENPRIKGSALEHGHAHVFFWM